MRLFISFLIATACGFSQAAQTPTIQHATVTLSCTWLDASSCVAHTLVTAHPSSASVVGFLVTLTYRDYQGFGPRTVTVTTFDRNSAGDFVVTAAVGDVVVSGLELYAGQLVQENQPKGSN